ncbi:hypothetical protein AZF08_19675 [Bacillus gaemokensis]|nr:hypothetical protein AZF08_19675 [Bacillus gaemokensis]
MRIFFFFVKVSDEAETILTNKTNMYEAAQQLLSCGAKSIAITLGSKGTLLATNETQIIIPSISVQQVDSTGADNAFVGAMLYQFSKEKDCLSKDFVTLIHFVSFANKFGAIICTNYGAIDSLPTLEDMKAYD